uniref:Uncharacterized protein n=1 Tax=Melopsittacus undulatus TaxID=13146 RepID=A0A8V5GAE6_MELUD
MSEFQPSCQNGTPGLFNRSWKTVILPSLTAIICITGLVRNILIVFTIVRTQRKTIPDIYICNLAIVDLVHITGMPFLTHQWACGGEWVFGSPLCTIITSLDTCNQFMCSAIMTTMSLDRYVTLGGWRRYRSVLGVVFSSLVIGFIIIICSSSSSSDLYTLYLTITTFFFPLPLIYICYILILCYTWEMYQQNNYTTSIPRQRILRLTKMMLAPVSVFVVSTAPFHVIQLMNLHVSQPTLTFYVSYYISICLNYTSSSINPFLYILFSGNFQKHLWQCTNVEVRMADQDDNVIEKTLKSNS